MGYPSFYWHPDGSGPSASLETTSLGEELSALEVSPIRERMEEVALSGRAGQTVVGASMLDVRITLERFTSGAVARALETLATHLERGDYVGFCLDPDDAWAGYLLLQPSRGATILHTTGNVWWGSGTLAANDVLCIEGLGAEGHREYVTVQSVSGGEVTLAAGVVYTYTDEAILVRHRDYWPILYRPASETEPIVTTVRRIHYTLDVLLRTDPAVLARLATMASASLVGATVAFNRATLKELLGYPTNYRESEVDPILGPIGNW